MKILSLSFAAGFLALTIAACGDDGPTGTTGFEVVSPSSTNLTLDATESLRFEIRTSEGFRVEFVVDDAVTVPGPVFIFEPSARTHTVVARIFPPDPNALPTTRVFTITVTGNLPPRLEGLTVNPASGEAGRDEFLARVQATDPDGSIESVAFDFGDGTSPQVMAGPGVTFEARHVYEGPGSFVVRVSATDADGATGEATASVQVTPRNMAPTGSLDATRQGGGPPEGGAPLTIFLRPQGNDSDGTVAQWEIDPDDGTGFRQIAAGETVTVEYPFRETLYVPRLRLTDDDGAETLVEGPAITVFRGISPGASGAVTTTGNQRFAGVPIAPAVWADGADPWTIAVRVRNASGDDLPDVPVRVTSLRPRLIAPDGAVLPVTQFLLNPFQAGLAPAQADPPELGQVRTGSSGEPAVILLATNTSTRIDRIGEPTNFNFEPFGLALEASRGHGEWIEIGSVEGLNAETTVLFEGGAFRIERPRPDGICPGDEILIEVTAEQRFDAPGGLGPAAGRYTVLRFGTEWFGAVPTPEFADWRTNAEGKIVFSYVPVPEDDNRAMRAWVDGLPIEPIGLLPLLPPGTCQGS